MLCVLWTCERGGKFVGKDVPKEITRARVAMLFDHPFFASLLLHLTPVEDDTLEPPTMATDGNKLYFHPEFLKKITLPQLQGCMAHEIYHIILRHIPRRQNREHKRWNYAADYAINPLILKEYPRLQLPPGILQDQNYVDRSVEEIYNMLPMDDSGGGSWDSHEIWGNWGKEDDKDGDSESGSMGDLEEEWAQRVAIAAQQAKMQGKLPAHIQEMIEDLLQPKLDWRHLLQDRITSCARNDFRLSPANKKHLWRGFILPSIGGESICIAYIIDSSGSVSKEDIREALSEVLGICESYEEFTIHLYFADAEVNSYYELHQFDPLPKIIEGRGGTDFRPAIAAAEALDGVTTIVYHTDMYGTFPDKEPRIPVIWLATSDQKPPWGHVIRYGQ